MNMFIRFPSQALFKTIVPLVLLVFLLPCTLLLANNPPTGAVTITGTATQGQTLTADNNLTDADGLGTITYQWKRDGVPIMYGVPLKDGVGGVDGLDGPRVVTLSADGKHAYVTGYDESAVSWYERNASTGALTYGGVLKDGVGGVDGLNGASGVTLSADGNHAYVTG
jgi:DNA-binding beta-propeller fold protein YncE